MAAGTVLLEHFGFVRTAGAGPSDRPLRFLFSHRPAPAPPDGSAVIARHLHLVVRAAGERLTVDDGHSVAHLDLAAGVAELHARSWPAGAAAGRPYLIVVYALLTLLRRRGLVPLHAAALEREGDGLLMVAPSGSGKSTLSLVLLRSGWRVVSDDSVLLQLDPASGRVTAHGLRRDLFLRSPERDFPELAELWTSSPELDRGKRRLVVERAFPGRAVRACVPSCILLPELADLEASWLEACPPDELLFRLLDHSTIADLEPGASRRHMEVLGALVRQAGGYRLEAAGDLLADPGRLAAQVEPLLGRSGPPRETAS